MARQQARHSLLERFRDVARSGPPARNFRLTRGLVIYTPTPLALVIAESEQVFESRIAAIEWVYAPSAALGGVAPFDLLTSDSGVQLVLSELGRIEYGLPV